MTMLTLGLAADEPTIAANCLWPRTAIRTAAVQNLLGGDATIERSRTTDIVADAAYAILRRSPSTRTGRAMIDDEVLAEVGVTDLSGYHPDGRTTELQLDFFIAELPGEAPTPAGP